MAGRRSAGVAAPVWVLAVSLTAATLPAVSAQRAADALRSVQAAAGLSAAWGGIPTSERTVRKTYAFQWITARQWTGTYAP